MPTMPNGNGTNVPYTDTPPGVGSGNLPGSSSPYSTAPGMPGGMPSGLTSQEQSAYNAFMSNPDLAGILNGIGGGAEAVWGWIQSLLPKNADGSIDWGKIGSDVVGWVKNNAGQLIQGATSLAAAYGQYERQQQSDKYAGEALNGIPGSAYAGALGQYAATAPLRAAGTSGMLNPRANTPDLSNIQKLATTGSGNPFARGLQPLQAASTTPTLPPATTPTRATLGPQNGPPPASDTGAPMPPAPTLTMPLPPSGTAPPVSTTTPPGSGTPSPGGAPQITASSSLQPLQPLQLAGGLSLPKPFQANAGIPTQQLRPLAAATPAVGY